MANKPEDWNALAERLDSLARDMMAQSNSAPDEFDEHMIILWSRSLMHCAIEMRFFAGEGLAADHAAPVSGAGTASDSPRPKPLT